MHRAVHVKCRDFLDCCRQFAQRQLIDVTQRLRINWTVYQLYIKTHRSHQCDACMHARCGVYAHARAVWLTSVQSTTFYERRTPQDYWKARLTLR